MILLTYQRISFILHALAREGENWGAWIWILIHWIGWDIDSITVIKSLDFEEC